MQLRTWLARALLGVLIAVTAFMSVGLTAPDDGPFSIAIHPIFLRLESTAGEEPRGRALGLDLDVKIGAIHVHLAWTALQLSRMTES